MKHLSSLLRKLPIGLAAGLSLSMAHSTASANSDLANQATNPAAALIQLQLQNVFQPNSRNSDGVGNQFIIQPVVPFSLTEPGDGILGLFDTMVWRGTLPVVTTPDYEVDIPGGAVSIPTPGGGTIVNSPLANFQVDGTTDLGDFTNIFAFPVKVGVSKTFGYSWAPIAAIALPTATSNITGTGKVSPGVGALLIGGKKNLFANGDTLQFGAYGYNLWSIAGEGSRNEVNTFFMGPIATYHFSPETMGSPGWYLRWTDQLMSFDWNQPDGGIATIPVGAAIGKVFTIGNQPVNFFIGADYFAAHRGDHAPYYDIKANLTFLFPK